MGTVVKVALGVLLAGMVLIVGCVALLDASFKEVEKEDQARAVSRAQIRALEKGMSRRAVIAELGKPESTQEDDDELGRTDYLYYNVKGGETLESWQLVFEKGKLRAKNRS